MSSSNYDLYKLAEKYDLLPINIIRLDKYKESDIPSIINMGLLQTGIFHWVAVYGDYYFDSFGVAPTTEIKNKIYSDFDVQSIRSGHCGEYCILWLYYMKKDGKPDNFYKLFENLNPIA